MSEWYVLALEFKALGYSMGEFIVFMALHLVAIPDAGMRQVRAAFLSTVGGDGAAVFGADESAAYRLGRDT